MTKQQACEKWVGGFNAMPTSMLEKLWHADIDSMQEVTMLRNDEEDFRDSALPAWGTMWSFGDSCDDHWIEEMGGVQALSDHGFRIYEHEDFGYFFGIDGAGYNFYEQHWLPLYDARGLQWHEKEIEKMTVLIVEPSTRAYEADIGNRLEDLQEIVGGHIQAVYPYEEPVALICNEEGKMAGLPLNRALYDNDGQIYDIVAGTFIVCGLSEDNFASLAPADMLKFHEQFLLPETFVSINGDIRAVKTGEVKLSLKEALKAGVEKSKTQLNDTIPAPPGDVR